MILANFNRFLFKNKKCAKNTSTLIFYYSSFLFFSLGFFCVILSTDSLLCCSIHLTRCLSSSRRTRNECVRKEWEWISRQMNMKCLRNEKWIHLCELFFLYRFPPTNSKSVCHSKASPLRENYFKLCTHKSVSPEHYALCFISNIQSTEWDQADSFFLCSALYLNPVVIY